MLKTLQMPRHAGFELTQELIQKQADTVKEALLEFKCGVEKATQIEKCLIFERRVESVTFCKQTLEVVVSLSDGRAGVAGQVSLRRATSMHAACAKMAARTRVGEHESQDLPREGNPGFQMVEAVGIEPTSPAVTSVASTCLVASTSFHRLCLRRTGITTASLHLILSGGQQALLPNQSADYARHHPRGRGWLTVTRY